MSLPSELRAALPAFLAPEQIRAAARSSGSRGSISGETWLVEVDGELRVLTRQSIFDELEILTLAADGAPPIRFLEDGYASRLELRCADGGAFELRPSRTELEAARALLDRLGALASTAPARPPQPTAPPALVLGDPVASLPTTTS